MTDSAQKFEDPWELTYEEYVKALTARLGPRANIYQQASQFNMALLEFCTQFHSTYSMKNQRASALHIKSSLASMLSSLLGVSIRSTIDLIWLAESFEVSEKLIEDNQLYVSGVRPTEINPALTKSVNFVFLLVKRADIMRRLLLSASSPEDRSYAQSACFREDMVRLFGMLYYIQRLHGIESHDLYATSLEILKTS